MVATDKVFAGSVPEIYDRLMVPLIFEPYATDLAGRIAAGSPRAVLETAAGTGVLTRALVSRLPASTRLVATDLNQPMLDQAARRLPPGRVELKQADALALPFEAASFDAVACQFGVMFFPDRVKGYREARRLLRSGGRFLFNAWHRIEDNEIADVVTQALAEVFPQDPPRFMARTPHGYHDAGQIRADLKDAGFTEIAVDTVDARSPSPSARDAAVAYCQGTPLRGEIETRDALGLARATEHAERALQQRFGTGAVDGRIRALVATASG